MRGLAVYSYLPENNCFDIKKKNSEKLPIYFLNIKK